MEIDVFKKVITILILLLLLSGCGMTPDDSEVDYIIREIDNVYSGSDAEIYPLTTTEDVELTYSLNLGASSKDVYFIFTNTDLVSEAGSPYLLASTSDIYNIPVKKFSVVPDAIPEAEAETGKRGKPEISDFNNNPWDYIGSEPETFIKRRYKLPAENTEVLKSTVGTGSEFLNTSSSDKIPSTLRKIVSAVNGRTLNIWVADDCWNGTGTGKAFYVNQTMVDILADKFLTAGDDNDIYEWVTDIFGQEWGSHSYDNLVGVTNQIDILLYDIDNDNSTTGGVLGFYWAKDNFLKSSMPNSNEKIMFYADAVLYATHDGTWEITDKWPQEIISTLTHEFQHLVHFYQKIIVNNARYTEKWLNEMASLVAEDLIAQRAEVNGPRGVAFNTAGAGSGGNVTGRLPLYNYSNSRPLTVWTGGDDNLGSYSTVYAFGAYIARNYGGAKLIGEIVRNPFGNYRAVIDSVKDNGGSSSLTFGDLLRDWGISVLLSDKTGMPAPLRFNTGTWFTDALGYNLGSINHYNYSYNSTAGPFIYPIADLDNLDYMNSSSNLFVYAGNLTGNQSWVFRMRDSVRLTVVVR